jgi:hypothetical protein
MSILTPHQAAAVFTAITPALRLDVHGRARTSTKYRGGDNPTAVSIDTLKGGRYFDQVTGKGGDVIDYVKEHLGTNSKGACKFIADIAGQDLAARTEHPRPRFSNDAKTKAARFRVGILWRLERNLAVVKAELFGPQHDKAAAATKDLTTWRAIVEQWSLYRAQAVMTQLNRRCPQLVAAAVAEAAEAERELMEAIGAKAA